MFRGINPINLDAKGRVALPAKYRDRVTDRCDGHMVLTVHPFDRCLLLYPLTDWEVIEAQVNALPNSTSRQARRLQHLMVGYATELDLDAANRLLLPAMHRDHAELDKRLILVGQGQKFEVWNEARWTSMTEAYLNEPVDADASVELTNLSL
ncbi:MAG TPA: cell division/cell wall cluster transcriptional repressor MraZ [Gammaproteobacteria bacterium]|nr:cell division/cell wall cluster transcriptional repressor MraZ [Gammaproteobacteria bacterium]MBL6737333.1 division/cell wall cluster transcriptional repressor MraZ [Litorivicinus sp.]MDB2412291.1 division/cell wall cluster transcriptional repressor MraZ [Litorivicinaceae bacterium]OUX70351.1 MAG: cell division/cell wall cluster transcriptional repressor MraZ [Oceanospirillales bacterium TMED91]MAJ42659.1 cell division/cell wall cluster transcriptional repressor MraZ [Gammaproteobacteria bac